MTIPLLVAWCTPAVYAQSADRSAASAGIRYLATVMDQYHNRFPVYDDVSSGGNHFSTFAKFPDPSAQVAVNGSWTDRPHTGATCLQFSFTPTQSDPFGGWYMQTGILASGSKAPVPNFGVIGGNGFNLTGATSLTFWARGAAGGEQVEFFLGGVGWDPNTGRPQVGTPFPDSTSRLPASKAVTVLTNQWKQYTINLTGANLSYLQGGFAWVASVAEDPNGCTFYVDDIQYNLNSTALNQRLNQPHFLKSFTTLPVQDLPAPVNNFDLALRNTAFLYDNAVAVLAFLADGTADSIRRAKLIGDAFVYASNHDRTFTDGRLRDDYSAGDVSLPPGWTPNGVVGASVTPGFYDETLQTFYEIGQTDTDTGNNAWAMLALMGLYNRTGNSTYLVAAERIGEFIHAFRNDSGTYQGFLGGIILPESDSPTPRPYASSEHNIDINAAFTQMSLATGDVSWQADAQHASDFVESMWDPTIDSFRTGTTDENNINTTIGQLPVDVQAWSTLSIPGKFAAHPDVLAQAIVHQGTTRDGFTGWDFNDDRDHVWFEGTAQMADAYSYANEDSLAAVVRQTLRTAQSTPPFGDGFGIAAASYDGLTTGFGDSQGNPNYYFRRLHVGATAWNVLAQLKSNPFNPSAHVFPAGVQLVTYPFAFTQDMATLFGNPAIRAAVWQPSALSYAVTPTSPANSIQPGRAYWFNFAAPAAVNQYGTPAPFGKQYRVDLQQGWNMVGNPYLFPVSTTTVSVAHSGQMYSFLKAVNAGFLSNTIYTYQAGDTKYEVISGAAATLQPYYGYWVYAFSPCTVVFPAR